MRGLRGLLAVGAAVLLLAAACSDPRGRPVPPSVRVDLDPDSIVTSPGRVYATVRVEDENGVDSVIISLRGTGTASDGDSVLFPDFDAFLFRHDLAWYIPPGVLVGTGIDLVVRARSFTGLAASDTVTAVVSERPAGTR